MAAQGGPGPDPLLCSLLKDRALPPLFEVLIPFMGCCKAFLWSAASEVPNPGASIAPFPAAPDVGSSVHPDLSLWGCLAKIPIVGIHP